MEAVYQMVRHPYTVRFHDMTLSEIKIPEVTVIIVCDFFFKMPLDFPIRSGHF